MTVAKIIEIVGSSERGWSEAAQEALDEAKKTINGITGLEVILLQKLIPAVAR